MNPKQDPSLAAKTLTKALWAHHTPADILKALAVRNWLSFSEESLSAAAQELEQHWSVRHAARILSLGGATLLTTFLLLATWLYADAPSMSRAQKVAGTLLTGGFFGFIASVLLMYFVVMPLLQQGRPEKLRLLSPASREPFLCATAVDFVEKFGEVRQYRDQVTGSGRALRVADLEVLNRLGYQAREQAREEAQRATCQRLHGLAVDPA